MSVTVRRIDRLDSAGAEALADILIDCVDGGASVSFLWPLERSQALAFWQQVAHGVAAGERVLLVAEDEQGPCGTVQLVLAMPPNQPHRAEVSKMLVHRRARRRGVGAALMLGVEQAGRDRLRTLLVLDTETGSDADRLYTRLGWQRVGEIPDFALGPRGGWCATTIFYRRLD